MLADGLLEFVPANGVDLAFGGERNMIPTPMKLCSEFLPVRSNKDLPRSGLQCLVKFILLIMEKIKIVYFWPLPDK